MIAGLKALRENSVQIFLLPILSLDVLKRIVKIFPKILLNKEMKKPELKFNPGLKLIGLRTTGPWSVMSEFLKQTRELVNLLSVSNFMRHEKRKHEKENMKT